MHLSEGLLEKEFSMRRKRIIYFNDARHYYLFVFEPPMKLEDAWVPVDEAAGTSVDTFIYGVARGDGLFYPSKVGQRFGHDMKEFKQAAYWRVWYNMQSLMDRGLDPLKVLIDRAHDKGMDFFASLRMSTHECMDPAHRIENGGGAMAHPEVRDHHFAVLEELVADYDIEGVELDFAVPGGGLLMPIEEAPAATPAMTEYVGRIAAMVRRHPGKQVGIRVLPTEALNRAQGLDVCAWLQQGHLDYVVPIRYGYQILDPDMPINWLIEAAHQAEVSVYPSLQPYQDHQQTGAAERIWATPAQMRAAVANFWERGADGFYAWFLRWPFDDAQRRILTELGDPDLVKEGDKHYCLARDVKDEKDMHYRTSLPVEIQADDTGTRHPIPFHLADDTSASDRIRQIQLKLRIYDLVSTDRLEILLNGRSLEDQTCLRDYYSYISAYSGQWLEFHLRPEVWPRKGDNLLEIALQERAERLVSPLRIEKVEILVEYGPYPSSLRVALPSQKEKQP